MNILTYFRHLPIRKKIQSLNLIISSLIGLITLLTVLNLSFFGFSSLLDNYQKRADTAISVLAESLNTALLFNDTKVAQNGLGGLSSIQDITQAAIYDKSGHLFSGYARAGNPDQVSLEFNASKYGHSVQFGDRSLYFASPILGTDSDREQIGTLTLHMDLSKIYTELSIEIGAVLLVGLLSLLLVYTIINKLQQSITLPLQSLTDVMRKVSEKGDLSAHAEPFNQDEIGDLAKAFNHMIGELSQREESLRQEFKERRRVEDKLSETAHFDSITHLPNRHSFDIRINEYLLNHKHDLKKLALMYIDLDNFKYVNDTFGHHLGDLLLVKIAERLCKSLRQADFVARLGGDEFAVIMSDFTDVIQISAIARKILEALQVPLSLEGRELFVSASLGITIFPDNGTDRETLQSQADNAMYHAKSLGKNNFQFYQTEFSQLSENRISIESQLRHSLERNEIVVYYQPIVEIDSQRIVGFEALVRWIKQDGTVIRPDQFITLAEEIGLIVDIGRYVLNTATAQAAIWVEHFGLTFTAVNFSSRQFKHNDLAADIFNALKNAQLQPGNFEMEITESVLMDNTIDSKSFLEMLIKQGMGISIDDFGTGYSSLSYITSFPITKIKIDISFVAKLPHDKNALAVVTAIISLARSLDMKVVAEGIETAEQLACLKMLGCQYGQGYLFSKPVPAAAATKLLEMGSNGAALSNITA